MKLEDWEYFFIFIGFVVIIILLNPIIKNDFFLDHEEFFEMAILGKNKLAEDYFIGSENITIGKPIEWYIYIFNHMGELKKIEIKVKIIKSYMMPPDSVNCEPDSEISILDIPLSIENNEFYFYNFTWLISEVFNTNDKEIMIKINDVRIQEDISINDDSSFRILFELWVYNEKSKQYEFGWLSKGEPRCVWNQIWCQIS